MRALFVRFGRSYSWRNRVLPLVSPLDARCSMNEWHPSLNILTQAFTEREAIARPWTISHPKLIRERRYWHKTFDFLYDAPAGRIGTMKVWHDPDRACCKRESWGRTLCSLFEVFPEDQRANIEAVAREHDCEHFAFTNSIFRRKHAN